MITEDYVSFETAKLLKEKGFDETCSCYYFYNDETQFSQFEESLTHWNWNNGYTFRYSAPTLQMAMKWLREVHKLHCDIGYDDLDWFWNIISVSNGIPVEDRPKLLKNGFAGIATYEQACEAAIKYCLENLI